MESLIVLNTFVGTCTLFLVIPFDFVVSKSEIKVTVTLSTYEILFCDKYMTSLDFEVIRSKLKVTVIHSVKSCMINNFTIFGYKVCFWQILYGNGIEVNFTTLVQNYPKRMCGDMLLIIDRLYYFGFQINFFYLSLYSLFFCSTKECTTMEIIWNKTLERL